MPANTSTRQPAGVAQISSDLREWSPSEELPEDVSNVFGFGFINSVPCACGISLEAWHPAVPVGRLAWGWVPREPPADGVACSSLRLDSNLAFRQEHQLLEHEVIQLSVDTFADNDDPDVSTRRADVEHVDKAASDARCLGNDYGVILAGIECLEHR